MRNEGGERPSHQSAASFDSRSSTRNISSIPIVGLTEELKESDESEGRLRLRDWMVGFCEFSLEFCFAAIMHKHSTEEHALRSNLTPSASSRELLLTAGCSGIGSLLFGYIGDSYIGNYSVAVFNVSLHFIVGCLYFIEAVLTEQDIDDDNVKSFTTKAWIWTVLFTSATKYSRIAYPFEQLLSLTKSTITFYAFFITWTGRFGYFARMTAEQAGLSRTASGTMTFIFCGISLFLYANVLRPPSLLRGKIDSVNEIVGCVFASLYFKLRRRKRPANSTSWLDFALYKYDRATILKTRRFLKFCLMILPLCPILTFLFNVETLSFGIAMLIKRAGVFYSGMDYVMQGLTVLMMPVVHFVALQFMRSNVNLRTNLVGNLVVGHIAAFVALYGLAAMIGVYDDTSSSFSVGTVRIFNAGEKSIHLQTQDATFTLVNLTILPHSTQKAAFSVSVPHLFKMTIIYGPETNFTTFLSTTPNECTGYVITSYPKALIGVHQYLPVTESEPGLNDPTKASVYVINTVEKIGEVVFSFINEETMAETQMHDVTQGSGALFQLVPGSYTVRMSSKKQPFGTYSMQAGGVYGFILYSIKKDLVLGVDLLRPQNSEPSKYIWLLIIGIGIALSTLYIALVAFVFIVSPPHLRGTSFGYLFLLKDGFNWYYFTVFTYWHHRFSTSDCVMFGFSIGSCFFVTLFVVLHSASFFRY